MFNEYIKIGRKRKTEKSFSKEKRTRSLDRLFERSTRILTRIHNALGS